MLCNKLMFIPFVLLGHKIGRALFRWGTIVNLSFLISVSLSVFINIHNRNGIFYLCLCLASLRAIYLLLYTHSHRYLYLCVNGLTSERQERHQILQMNAQYAVNMQKRFSRAKKTYQIRNKNKLNNSRNRYRPSKNKIAHIHRKDKKNTKEWRRRTTTKQTQKTTKTWKTKLFYATKCHQTTKMFWLNHVEKCEPFISISLLNKSACHLIDLHAFWRLPSHTFHFSALVYLSYISNLVLVFASFSSSFTYSHFLFYKKNQNCFTLTSGCIVHTVRFEITQAQCW